MASDRPSCLSVVLGCVMLLSAACGSDDDEPLFVTMQERSLTADGWQDAGGGCMVVFDESDGSAESSSGSAGSGAIIDGGLPPSPLSVFRSTTAQGLRVVVTSDAQALAIKIFTREFLESGEIDRFEVTTPDGVRHQFAHRGSHECETDIDLFDE